METLRQVAGSLLLAAFSAALVIGGISLALAESQEPEIFVPTQTQAQIFVIDTLTLQPVALVTESVPPSNSCLPPADWIPVIVQPGEDLATLANRHQSTPEELSRVNCLLSSALPAGSTLYVPLLSAKTVAACGPPPGWRQYSVQAGNTMFSISHAYGISIPQLQSANCIASNQFSIRVGQILWVPNVSITRTPLASATPSLTPVSMIFPTLTYTATPTATASVTPTHTSTVTVASPTTPPTASATVTSFPSATPVP